MFGVKNDGWNWEELATTGLNDFMDDVKNLEYELKNCRRNSYAKFGENTEDLIPVLTDLKDQIEEIIVNIENNL